MRTVVDVDPEEWSALWSRRWQMYLDGIWPDRYHEDAEQWGRLDALRAGPRSSSMQRMHRKCSVLSHGKHPPFSLKTRIAFRAHMRI